jgi:hypothetical protein
VLLVLLLAAHPLPSRAEAPERTVEVIITNRELTVRYRITVEPLAVAERVERPKASGADWPPELPQALEHVSARRNRGRALASTVGERFGLFGKWASVSPDCQHAAVALEDPLLDKFIVNVVVLNRRTPGGARDSRLQAQDRFRDLQWTKDSSHLLLLEDNQRLEKTPWALLSALAGHGVPLSTVTLRTLDLRTSATGAVPLARDIRYATVLLNTGAQECPPANLSR